MARHTVDSLLETVHPGLLRRLEALGGERIEPWVHSVPEYKMDVQGTLVMAQAAVRRVIPGPPGRSCVVNIAFRCHLKEGKWKPASISFHCGPDRLAMDEVYFRIDANNREGFHCHIRGYGPKPEKGGHIPVQDVIPRPTLNPFDFLDFVEQFVKNGDVPLSVR